MSDDPCFNHIFQFLFLNSIQFDMFLIKLPDKIETKVFVIKYALWCNEDIGDEIPIPARNKFKREP
ncbi:MAG: hypothetical protein A3J37_06505 [Alphaproteobacteria bacterium RIFCSPHIGHO2_12_FULL_45_9]|nr:MAG: hypothetical protein A3B66_09950 [Alphaproteobacteria bacterium RIFCSPHIGHO2_02_FULL_46_13]OFW96393.1 MAG: hypothetical protein A3J37_06505 [Alphaproteobacteria bacterium RIFCSPHIGHO2_12_FULL_45_9]